MKILKITQNNSISLTFIFQYVNEFLSSGNDQGMESILKFSNFSQMFEKRAWRTHNAPKPANEDFENDAKNMAFSLTLTFQYVNKYFSSGND